MLVPVLSLNSWMCLFAVRSLFTNGQFFKSLSESLWRHRLIRGLVLIHLEVYSYVSQHGVGTGRVTVASTDRPRCAAAPKTRMHSNLHSEPQQVLL